MCKTTATQISKESICKKNKDQIYQDLKSHYFGLMFDESSDQFGPALLCTHVRYIKDSEFQIKLLSVNEIGAEATGEALEKIAMEEIFPKEKELLIKENLIGICSDKGPNMLSSKEKSLTNRLVKNFKQNNYKNATSEDPVSINFNPPTKI